MNFAWFSSDNFAVENEQPCKKVIKYPDIVTKECVIKNDTEDSDDKHYEEITADNLFFMVMLTRKMGIRGRTG